VSTYVLIPGAGGVAWYWSRVVPLLEAAGHRAVAVDLPGDDPTAGLPEYTQLVLDAAGEDGGVILVAQSMGAFTAAMAAGRLDCEALVFLNGMVPLPNEKPGEWWEATGYMDGVREAAARERGYSPDFDVFTYFLHDLSPEVIEESAALQRNEDDAAFESPCEFEGWPEIPLRSVAGKDDRFFPANFQQRVARERLGIEADLLPGGHLAALAHPEPLTRYLLALSR
jgi:pimeloyl-ACP methyl ester carboxylesterase